MFTFKIITYSGWKKFWGIAFRWFTSRFSSVEDKIDNIVIPDPDLSAIAHEANATANKEAIITAVNNAQPDLSSVAQRSDVKDGNDTAIGMLKDQTNGLAAIKTALGQINVSALQAALQGNDTTATLTAILTALQGQGEGSQEELPEGLADRVLLLLQHFGIAGSYEAEAKGGERTNNTVIDECKVRFQDAFNGLLPTGFTMPNSVTVDYLTYTGTTNS